MYLAYEKRLIPNARRLRKNMTPQEWKLWYCFLRTCEKKFVRQRTIGRYIVDFYCAVSKLAIEVDGGQHYEKKEQQYDQTRTEALNAQGIRVLRLTNREINEAFRAACEQILQLI